MSSLENSGTGPSSAVLDARTVCRGVMERKKREFIERFAPWELQTGRYPQIADEYVHVEAEMIPENDSWSWNPILWVMNLYYKI